MNFIHLFFMLLLSGSGVNTQKSSFHQIVIFGDSNSDQGNVYKLTNSQIPGAPYFAGRFTNGPVWSEKLIINNVSNYAYGGATTDDDLIQSYAASNSIRVIGVRQQIAQYWNVTERQLLDFDRILYIIWAGGNNYLRNQSTTPAAVIQSLLAAASDLLKNGVKHLILFNQPPFDAIPTFRPLATQINMTSLNYQFNQGLLTSSTNIQSEYKNATVMVFDLHSVIYRILQNATSYGIVNTIDRCWNSSSNASALCSNPNTFMFFDGVHFTSRIHQLIADQFNNFIMSSSSSSSRKTSISVFFSIVFAYPILMSYSYQL